MLIDKYLPSYDVREYHEAPVAADRATAYTACRAIDLSHSPIVRALFAIRTLPSRLRARRPRTPETAASPSFLESAVAAGWVILEEVRGQELVVGAVTQPWAAVVTFRGMPGPDFVAFAEPGFTKIAWNIAVRTGAGRTVVSTETRVAATDPDSLRRFRRYWLVVRPGVRLIRRVLLAQLQRELRDAAPPAAG